MRKLLVILLAVLFLNGCAQTTSMVGPTYTLVKTGSVVQAGSSIATSYGVKHSIRSITIRIYFFFSKKRKEKSRECQTFHSST